MYLDTTGSFAYNAASIFNVLNELYQKIHIHFNINHYNRSVACCKLFGKKLQEESCKMAENGKAIKMV